MASSPWWQHGIIYQIYPRSFADSNGDGIGDLDGITARLDYLSELGVDALWLSPVYPSPDVDFGYDVSDYCAIDPQYGTMDDFDRLVEQAHARGIRVVLDLVLNHTSDQHPWFQESRSSRDNPRRGWYIWADPAPGGGPPNNWQSVFGGPGWEWDEATGQYYFHMFYKEQPDVNWHNPEVRQAMLDVFRFWLERGVDGFRLDVFNAYFKDAHLTSNPETVRLPLARFVGQRHLYDYDQPEMVPLLREVRALLDAYSTPGRERYAVGETFGNIFSSTASQAARYIAPDQLHAAFNFDLLGCRWNAGSFRDTYERWEHVLGDSWPNNVLNNHDVTRSATRYRRRIFGSPESDARLKVAAALLLTLRGTPFLYYGEEIGMRDIPIRSKEQVLDPIGKTFWPIHKGRDGCRSPMQWDGSPNAGFSATTARPWLPLHENAAQRNVQAQLADPKSLLNTYKRLIALRRSAPALTEGMYQPLTYGTRYIMAYLRQNKDQVLLVALNFSGRRQRLVLGGQLSRARFSLCFSTHRSEPPPVRNSMITLEPNEALVMEIGG